MATTVAATSARGTTAVTATRRAADAARAAPRRAQWLFCSGCGLSDCVVVAREPRRKARLHSYAPARSGADSPRAGPSHAEITRPARRPCAWRLVGRVPATVLALASARDADSKPISKGREVASGRAPEGSPELNSRAATRMLRSVRRSRDRRGHGEVSARARIFDGRKCQEPRACQ